MPGQGEHTLPEVLSGTHIFLRAEGRYHCRSCIQTGQSHYSPTVVTAGGGGDIRRGNTHYLFEFALTALFEIIRQQVGPVTPPAPFQQLRPVMAATATLLPVCHEVALFLFSNSAATLYQPYQTAEEAGNRYLKQYWSV